METQIRKSFIVRAKRKSLDKPTVGDIIKRLARIVGNQFQIQINDIEIVESGMDFVDDKVSIIFSGISI